MIVFDNKKQPYEKCGLYPSVAQLDNATDSDSGEWGFKSLRVDQKIKDTIVVVSFAFFVTQRNLRDLKPTVKKTVRWTAFREER